MLNPSDRLVGVSDDPILQLMNTDRFNVSEQSRCERILNHWYLPCGLSPACQPVAAIPHQAKHYSQRQDDCSQVVIQP